MKVATVHICRSWGKSLLLAPNDSCDSTTANSLTAISETNIQFHLACIASISVWLQSEERGMRVKDRAKNGASKRAGGGWEERFPSPPPSFIFWLLFHFSLGQNQKSRSSVFLCSETKWECLLCSVIVTLSNQTLRM